MSNSDLPEPGAPLQLADGTTIESTASKRFVAIPRASEARELVANTRKKLIDLPEPPEKMNIISVVAAYHLVGLSHEEIAVALQVDPSRVQQILDLDTFKVFLEDLIGGITERERQEVRGVITQTARNAAERVASLVASDNESVALAASRDLLDRDGHRPADIVEHRHSMDGGLTIRVVDGRNEQALDGIVIEGDV